MPSARLSAGTMSGAWCPPPTPLQGNERACAIHGVAGATAAHGHEPQPHDIGGRMGSNKKKKTTMAKLNRETTLRERRRQKQARKEARRQAAQAERSGPSQPAGH